MADVTTDTTPTGPPPMFTEGALVLAEYEAIRSEHDRGSVLGYIREVDDHRLTVAEVDHDGERTNAHRRVLLHAPSRSITSITDERWTSLGELIRIDYVGGPDIDASKGLNPVNAALFTSTRETVAGNLITEMDGRYRFYDPAEVSADE